MELPYIDFLEKHLGKPVLLAGPMIPDPPASVLDWFFDTWLKGFSKGSIMYCALGSVCVLTMESFLELVFGLEHTEMMRYVKPVSLFHDLLKSNMPKQGRLLGLDVGDKYVGLAVSDSDNKIATPLSVLLRKKSNIDLMATDFQSLISEFSLVGFIVGCPFDRQQNSPDATQVKLFVDDLCKTRKLEGLRYTYWNERFTSKNVELLLKPLKLHPVESKTILDKFAAVGILQGYLDYVNRNGINTDIEDLTGKS